MKPCPYIYTFIYTFCYCFSQVSYTIQYSNSSTDIVSVKVEFLLGSITAQGGLNLRQKVSVRFLKVRQGSCGIFSLAKIHAVTCTY